MERGEGDVIAAFDEGAASCSSAYSLLSMSSIVGFGDDNAEFNEALLKMDLTHSKVLIEISFVGPLRDRYSLDEGGRRTE